MDALAQLDAALNAIMAELSPSGRSESARIIARMLRGSQAKRIAAQRDPDGSPFSARKNPVRLKRRSKATGDKPLRKRATIKSKIMFRNLRTYRILKASSDADGASVGFTGMAARIASIHQDGLLDRPSRRSRLIRYPQRRLLGLTEAERVAIIDLMTTRLLA